MIALVSAFSLLRLAFLTIRANAIVAIVSVVVAKRAIRIDIAGIVGIPGIRCYRIYPKKNYCIRFLNLVSSFCNHAAVKFRISHNWRVQNAIVVIFIPNLWLHTSIIVNIDLQPAIALRCKNLLWFNSSGVFG